MVAASPASPPPTTMILGLLVAINNLLAARSLGRLLPRARRRIVSRIRTEKSPDRQQSDRNEYQCDRNAGPRYPLPRFFAYGDAPLGTKQEQTITRKPTCGPYPNHVKSQRPPVLQFHPDLVKWRLRICQQVNAPEPHGIGVPHNVSKGDRSSPTLGGIHEVTGPGIIA